MKFETSTDQLLAAVSTAARFTERRADLPVLSSILLTASGSRLTLCATNLDCGVEIVLSAKVDEEGVVSVPAGVFSGFLSNVRGKAVSGSLVGEVLKLETERASASIKTVPHDDFPILPRVSAERSFTIKNKDMSRAMRNVAYCASTSTVKPELQSVLMFGESGKLTAVATDSFRLAEKTITLKSSGDVPQMLIPARNAGELMRILDTANGDVVIYYNDNQISVQVDGIYYTSRLIDGAFPNYRQIVPKAFTTEVVILREDMATALKSLSVFADKFSQISLAIDPVQKAVLLTSRNPDVGEQVSTIRATISGDPLVMSFNGRYLADSLQAITGDSVRIHANGAGKPILIKDASDTSFFYLAMPMNR